MYICIYICLSAYLPLSVCVPLSISIHIFFFFLFWLYHDIWSSHARNQIWAAVVTYTIAMVTLDPLTMLCWDWTCIWVLQRRHQHCATAGTPLYLYLYLHVFSYLCMPTHRKFSLLTVLNLCGGVYLLSHAGLHTQVLSHMGGNT